MILADYLTLKSLTQAKAAAMFGCTQGRISQLLDGETPSFKLAQRIEKVTRGKVGIKDWPVESSAKRPKAA